MKFYRVHYQAGPRGEHIYPESSGAVIWRNVHYHPTGSFMIGETDSELVADGQEVVLLTIKEAKSALVELKKSITLPDGDPLSVL